MKKSIFTIIVATLLAISTSAWADGSIRCGNSLISVGDPAAVLLIKCGRPLTVDDTTRVIIDDYGHRQVIRSGEVWTMYMGRDHFIQMVTVEGGIITKIVDGPRG
ncbi:conserved hypothetical protein [Tolumonas auensis DSM 9187]|uniref:DUF2845 domain-containing protein n=1 Tax=Tolumonas auensis (strain DSM 9187 / NBRC 110442 / TA 4) TaxID=595494 RepID=C4LE65_TOLAT|nr:DUF2845 domain-containing protein [Tolumonas auensis]ACQ92886.1 conserved hypothetical protein [Tolumonas auensis DSM 9187]